MFIMYLKKTFLGIITISLIISLCVLTAIATVSYYFTVEFYPPNDTKAEATIHCQGGDGVYEAFVFIRSNSTGETSSNYGVTTGGNYTLSSGTVTIYYPGATIPLVTYDGWAE